MTAAKRIKTRSKTNDLPHLVLRNLDEEQNSKQGVIGIIIFFIFIFLWNRALQSGNVSMSILQTEMTVTERVQAAMQPFEAQGLVSRLEVQPGGIADYVAWMPYDKWMAWEDNPLYAAIVELEDELGQVIDFGVRRELPDAKRS